MEQALLPGIGLGTAVVVEEAELVIRKEVVGNPEAELERFKGALEQSLRETEILAEDLATRVGEKEAEILQGHMMLLSDPMLTGEMRLPSRMRRLTASMRLKQSATPMRICLLPWETS